MKELLSKFAKEFPNLKIPPPCFTNMGAEVIEWQEGKFLTVKFPVREDYQNPAQLLQGGFLAAMFDNVFGPFSFLEAKKPTTSLEMSFSYIRPVTPKIKEVTVKAILKEHSKNYLIMQGEAYGNGKVVCYANTRMLIFDSNPN